ncbi:MAG: hypothetical protein JXA09_17555 [Anaerolineae bacterium]|nr:hypothetical protein [Anaerolineae bacterium]
MIITLLFLALASLAVAGALGILFAHRIVHAASAFLVCAAAVAGLHGLLDLRYLAAAQAALGVGLGGVLLLASLPGGARPPRLRRIARHGIAVAPLLAIVLLALARGEVSKPALALPPVWASRGSYLFALGQQMALAYLVPVLLICLLLAVAALGVRVRRHPEAEDAHERGEP